MSDIFVSYASEDRARITPLVRALEARGLSLWWDRAIPGGVQYSDYIEDRLDACRCVLVIWSKVSVRSEWVKIEAAEGKKRDKLVPVFIDQVEQPLEFRRIQGVDLVGWGGDPAAPGFHKLCDDVGRLLGSAPASARVPVRRPRARRPSALVAAAVAAAVAAVVTAVPPLRRPVVRAACSVVRCDDRVVVGVMQITPRGEHVEGWWCDLTRDMLNATLNRFESVSVVSKQEIDFVREKEAVPEIEAARRLGIDRMVSGTLYRRGSSLILQLQVVEPGSGRMRAAKEARGTEQQLDRIQSEGAVEVIKALDVNIASAQLDEVLRLHGNARLDDYKLLADTMGGFEDDEPAAPAPGPVSRVPTPAPGWPAPAHAADGDERAVAELLERYRKALESEDLAQVAGVHVELTERMRVSLQQYFENARDLHVRFEDVAVRVAGDEALASFTRRDEFRDAASGRQVEMELRVSSVLERLDGEWKIRGLKRPS